MRVLLWDFDGTLGERVGGWSGVLLAAVERIAPGLGLTPEQVRPHLQRGFPWHTPDRSCAPPQTAGAGVLTGRRRVVDAPGQLGAPTTNQ